MPPHDANSISVRLRSQAGVLPRAIRIAFAASVFMLWFGVNTGRAFTDPSDVTGLVLWLDGDDLDGDGTVEGASEGGVVGGFVSTWVDKSASGFDMTQGTGGLRPSYIVGALNGRAILRFDGTDDFLLNATINQAQPSTMFIVWQLQEAAAGTLVLTDSNNGASTNTLFISGTDLNAHAGGGFIKYTPAFTGALVTAAEFNAAASNLYEDGVLQDTGNIGTDVLDGFIIGKDVGDTSPIQADVAEVLIYSRVLTSAERGQITEFLGDKWGVTVANTAPAVVAGGVLAYTENGPAAVIDAGVTVTDADDLDLDSGTVSITVGFDAGDVLAANTGGTAISASYNGGTGVLTLSNTDTVANYQQVLRTVTFTSTNDDPTASKTVTYLVNDGEDTASDTATINVTAQNDAPTVAAGGTLAYTENGPAAVIDAGVTVTDPDDTNMESGTVSITAGFDSGDTLAADTTGTSIVAAYNGGTGVLTLSNTDTVANYQQVLRTVTFTSTNDDPTASKTVTYLVNDGDDNGSDTATINVTAQNDAPVVAAGGTLNYTEGDPAAVIDAGVTVTDVDDTNMESGTVSITVGFDAGDVLAANTGGTAISASYNGATGVLTLSNADTVANYEQVLRTITFASTNDNPTAAKTVTYLVNDGDDNGSDTATINVTGDNDAPTLVAGGVLNYTAGDAAAVIDGALTVTDPDGPDMNDATVSITGGFTAAEDVLAATDQLGITSAYNAGTGVLTLTGAAPAADYQTVLRTVTYENTNATGASTVARTVTYAVNDGGADVTDTATVNVSVTPPANADPVLATNAGLTLAQGATATIGNTLLQVTDADNTAAELTFTLETAPANGELQLSGAALAATDTFTQDDVDNNRLTYVHDNSATTADSFDFSVADGAGGAIGATTFAITIEPAAATEPDLQITVESASGTAAPGDDIAFEVTVENAGAGAATGVEVVVPLPADTELVSVDVSAKQAAQDLPAGVTVADGEITIVIGDLAAGRKVVIDIVLRATAAGSVVLSASVTSEETPDAVAADAPATVAVEDAFDKVVTTHEPVRLCGAAGLFPWLMLCTLVGVKVRTARRRSKKDHSASRTSTDS